MAKRIIAVIMAAITVATVFTACSTSGTGETTTAPAVVEKEAVIQQDDSTFKLSYTQSDSLNPLEAVTLNNQILAQLVFESLFDLDDNFKASLNIASSYEYTDSQTLEVGIISGLKFSDGSLLTASDVRDSFNKAKESAYWGAQLADIKSCSVKSESEIVFKLERANQYAHNLLNFPIVSSEDSTYPVGNGRYYFADENGEPVLKANVTDSFNPYITTIHLENIAAEDSIDNAVNIGNISFAFRDLSSNTSRKMSANKKLVNMNNLVFIGVNNKSGITTNTEIRKAISLAINRNTLVKSAYGNFAQPATGVFNPQFELSQSELFEREADINAAKQAVTKSGLSNLSLSILVNSSNTERLTCAKLIKQQLEEAGFSVSITEESDNNRYYDMIQKEQFSLYIGEIKLSPDMSLYPFFDENGTAHFGIDTNTSQTAALYNSYIEGQEELGSFLISFSDEMPFIPLLYRKGMICFTKAMNGNVEGTLNDCFINIENWYFESE